MIGNSPAGAKSAHGHRFYSSRCKGAALSTNPNPQALNRSSLDAKDGAVAAPVRIVHVGVGAFMRAHSAWYTANATDAKDWGIAAFTGRRPDMADRLNQQDCLYTLVVRREDHNDYEVIGSISEAHPGSDVKRFVDLVSSPEVAIITVTITEAGYKLDAQGELDTSDPELVADFAAVEAGKDPSTALVRIALGLRERAARGSGPIAIVSNDNLMDNGPKLEKALKEVVKTIDPELSPWVDENVSFVSTSVDRITPRTDDSLIEEVQTETGMVDVAPVVTEPFADWVLSGDFPAGRPDWESAGALFTDEIGPYEVRKLWLLNGAHSLLAYKGLLEGHKTVAEAMGDPVCNAAVQAWWEEASRHLDPSLKPAEYCEQLTARFLNPNIVHLLEQIGNDGLTKLRQRVVPVALAELVEGRTGSAAAAIIANWTCAARGDFAFTDALAAELDPVLESGTTGDLVSLMDAELGSNKQFVELVDAGVKECQA